MAYLERYGTADVETIIFQNCPIQGTAVAGELYCRKFEINKDALVNYALDAIPALEQDFFQGFLYGLANGKSMEESCLIGNAVGAHIIMEVGASTGAVPYAEIEKFIKENRK